MHAFSCWKKEKLDYLIETYHIYVAMKKVVHVRLLGDIE